MKRRLMSMLLAAGLLAVSIPVTAALAEEELVLSVPGEESLVPRVEEDLGSLESLLDQMNNANEALMGTLGKKDWTALAAAVTKTGLWRDDLVAVAQTQVGYAEASDGSSIYAQWAEQDPADDWSAMFVSWAAEQTGLTAKQFPHTNSYEELVKTMTKIHAVKNISRANYPVAGDLALLKVNDHETVGVIAYVNNGYASVIIGDDNGAVTRTTYLVDGPEFKQFVDLTVLMERAGVETGKGGKVPAIPEGGVAAWTNTNAVYLRSEPTTASKSLTTVKKEGTALMVTSAEMQPDGYIWYGVEYKKYVGFIRSDLLDLDKAAIPSGIEEEKPATSLPEEDPGLDVQERVVNIEVIQTTEGQAVNITFDIYGATAYEWHEIRTPMAGTVTDTILTEATGKTLTVTYKSGYTYSYYCVATLNLNGTTFTVTSKTTTLDINSAPIVADAIVGEEVIFTYTCDSAFSYQWYGPVLQADGTYVSAPIEGATTSVYTSYADIGIYKSGIPFYCEALSFKNDVIGTSAQYSYNLLAGAEHVQRYIDELINMSREERYIAMTETWYVSPSEITGEATDVDILVETIMTYWYGVTDVDGNVVVPGMRDQYGDLLCICYDLDLIEDERFILHPYHDVHDENCPWYVPASFKSTGTTPEDGTADLGVFKDCSTFPTECALIQSWLSSNAAPMAIYSDMLELKAKPGYTSDGTEYDRYFAVLAHTSAHTEVEALLCSCAEDYMVLTAPGSAHSESCAWHIAGIDAEQVATRVESEPEFADWMATATDAMIKRALIAKTLDHLVLETAEDGKTYLYVARYEKPRATVDEEGYVYDTVSGLKIAQLVDGVLKPLY